MTTPTQHPRHAAILDAVSALIAQDGVASVNARSVAQRAGVAVGAIYLAFGTLDGAVVAANARTLGRIQGVMEEAVRGLDGDDPLTVLRALGQRYLAFALEERQAWSALFEFTPRDKTLLEIHHTTLESLVGLIAEPVVRLRPDWSGQEAQVRARTMFGAVHGVVHMALEGWVLGTPSALVEREVNGLITAMVRGYGSP